MTEVGGAGTLVDLSGDLTMKVVEIVTGAGLRRKPAVNRDNHFI